MKVLRFVLCMVLVASAVLYAAKNVLGPTSDGMVIVSSDPNSSLEEYVVTNGVGIKKWVLLLGGGPATKLTIDGKSGTSPADANILVNDAKMIKGKKISGSIANLIAGVFSPVGNFDPQDLGIMTNFSPGSLPMVKMKGVTIGTVIAGDAKVIQSDSIMNFATDSGFKGKGAAVQTKVGNVGGSPGDRGWLGVPPELQPLAALADYGPGCLIKMVKAKGAINDLDIYASPSKPGKSKLQGKIPGAVMLYNTAETDWKLKNVAVQ